MIQHSNRTEFAEVQIDDVPFRLWSPAEIDMRYYVPRPAIEEWLEQLVTVQYEGDRKMPVLLLGRPGTGKSMLAAALARRLRRPFWKMNAHNSLDATDLTCFARLKEGESKGSNIEYVLSPFMSGVHQGGVSFLDDVDKTRDETLSSILGLLDGETHVASGLGAANIPIHADSVVVFACNEQLALPEFFRSRVLKVPVQYISIDKTLEIVKQSGAIPQPEAVLNVFREAWLRNRPEGREDPSLREAFRACSCLAKLVADSTSRIGIERRLLEDQIIHGVLEV